MHVKRNGWSGQRRALAAVFAASFFVALVTGHALGAPPAPSPSISTQGVVIFGQTNSGTYRMNPDGTGIAQISTQVYPSDVSRGPAVMTVLIRSGAGIYAQRADGTGSPLQLLAGPNVTQPRFDADGDRMAWVNVTPSPYAMAICTADVVRDGSGEVTGLANTAVVWSSSAGIKGLDFSRDGSRIVFSMGNAAGYDLFVLNLGDGTHAQLTSTAEFEAWPRWSPVDDRIAYLRRTNASTNICSLLTIDYATSATLTILAGGSSQYAADVNAGLCWSPDATHLLTVVSGWKKPVDLYQFPSGGGKGVNVTGALGTPPATPCWGW